MYRYYLNIGTNLGDRERNLADAIKALSEGAAHIAVSKVVSSQPWGFESPHEFLNVGIAFSSPIEPGDMLLHIHRLERKLGSKAHRNADGAYIDRLIDIDIMAIEDGGGLPLAISTPSLTVPHPHLHDRPFFLTPYLELKADGNEKTAEKATKSDCGD